MRLLLRVVIILPLALLALAALFLALIVVSALEWRRASSKRKLERMAANHMAAPRTSTKTATVLIVVSALLAGQSVRAEEPDSQRPRWVIVATVVDRTTRQPLQQGVLEGPELKFEDAAHCKSILDRMHPVVPEGVAVILTCRKLPAEVEEVI